MQLPTDHIPGAYVQNANLYPPAQVHTPTAVPVFIGRALQANPLRGMPIRVASYLEFEAVFGQLGDRNTTLLLGSSAVAAVTDSGHTDHEWPQFASFYFKLELYFENGGGPCYIISGTYDNDPETGLDPDLIFKNLEGIQDITLVVPPAPEFVGNSNFYQKALAHCARMQNRFCIFDAGNAVSAIEQFRSSLGHENLNYGAAYAPKLRYSLSKLEAQLSGKLSVEVMEFRTHPDTQNGLLVYFMPATAQTYPAFSMRFQHDTMLHPAQLSWHPRPIMPEDTMLTLVLPDRPVSAGQILSGLRNINGSGKLGNFIVLPDTNGSDALFAPQPPDTSREDALEAWLVANPELIDADDSADADATAPAVLLVQPGTLHAFNFALKKLPLSALQSLSFDHYNQQRERWNNAHFLAPAAGAVTGQLCTIDREKGVWNAPAGKPLQAVLGADATFNHATLETLYAPSSGKAVNPIRNFNGSGTRIWGVKTLDAHDLSWRYINVRRLCLTTETTIRQLAQFALFEPNDESTWLAVKGRVVSLLNDLWRGGALSGTDASKAWYCKVGLNESMTLDDVLEGRLIIEVGIAPARPAEFIVVRIVLQVQTQVAST